MRGRNRLGDETSPYLLQHADNPVDWHPWGEAALALARDEDKPILLSIGYSACHWCHVMAHESFANESIAAVMNDLFINIKVDREERPDLDKVYQLAHAVLTRRPGGWPLTVFLAPDDRLPFFAGTYFPPDARHGMPAFPELLQQISAAYHERRDDIERQNRSLAEFFQSLSAPAADGPIAEFEALQATATEEALQQFEPRHGGFGRAPKFPHASLLDWVLQRWQETDDAGLGEIIATTLTGMAAGGLFDQIGGGFFRYSTDDAWMIPHFEKMLYDNGPLLALYTEAFAATGERLYAAAANETAEWLMREMQSPQGGYYATLDADSEGEEGRFYLWTPDAVAATLPAAELAVVRAVYGLDQAANFEGRWHLHVSRALDSVAATIGLDPIEAEARLDAGRQKLLAVRDQRVRPARDEKIITAWNGLAIRAMALAARQLNKPAFADSAEHAIDFVRDRLWRDGRLLSVSTQGQSRFAAYLDDHAFLLEAILALLQTRWDSRHLRFAVEIAELLLTHFQDHDRGGFYFTADDQECLIHRPKPFADESMPAGNGIAAQALIQLGFLLGENRFLEAADACLRAAADVMRQSPLAHASLLRALRWQRQPPEIMILRGQAETLSRWQQQLQRGYRPDRWVFAIPADAEDLPAALAEKKPSGAGVVYVCRGFSCSAPLTELPD